MSSVDVQRREASIEHWRKHFLMNNFEFAEPILNSPFGEPKAHWWIVEGETLKRGVNAVNADGGFGVWTYAVAKKVSDVPALISSAAR